MAARARLRVTSAQPSASTTTPSRCTTLRAHCYRHGPSSTATARYFRCPPSISRSGVGRVGELDNINRKSRAGRETKRKRERNVKNMRKGMKRGDDERERENEREEAHSEQHNETYDSRGRDPRTGLGTRQRSLKPHSQPGRGAPEA